MNIPTFKTERLLVFRFEMKVWQNSPRDYYLAFLKGAYDRETEDAVVYATVEPRVGEFPPTVQWIQTHLMYTKLGYASELIIGIEKHLGCELEITPVTPEGEGLCDRITRLTSQA